jgi:WYL_2, Sm-like SH3 beta-barrel fold
MRISQETAKRIIHETLTKNSGQMFSVKFKKKDGSIRDMVARLGVKKGVKGVGLNFNPSDYNLITAFDMQKKEFRMISINTLTQLKVDGKTFEVEG